ncbi:MAG TPA: diguanylate cyclase [Candidatus Gastranaerophilales bacterium]|nr:diguanylate cyclase [Candidatus Gastranaerophilales bacterium]
MSSKWYKNIVNKVKLFGNKVQVLESSVLDERKNYREIFERNLALEKEIADRTEELNQANKSLLTLKHIWSTMNSSEPLSEVLLTVVNGLSSELGYLQCLVFQLFDFESGSRLKIRASTENKFSEKISQILCSSVFSYDIPLGAKKNPIVQALKNNEIKNIKGFSQLFYDSSPEIEIEKLKEIDQLLGNKAICIFPIIVQGKPFGCFVTISIRNEILPTEQNFLTLFAGQIELAVTIANLFEQIKKQALTDALTGLFNRRHFDQCLATEVERSLRLNQPFTLISLDLDHLKKINDNYGHSTGDEAIKRIGEVLRKNARSVDIPARFGGEEFAVILPGIDVEGGIVAAERLKASIAESEVNDLEKITASIGVATFLRHTESLGELLELADQAMYRAKKNGRNRVEVATREEDEDWKNIIVEIFTEMLLKHKNSEVSKIVNKFKVYENQDINLQDFVYMILKYVSEAYNNVYNMGCVDEKLDVIVKMGKKTNTSEEEIEKFKIATMLYDIGRILMSEEIILKPGPLSKEEKTKVLENPILAAKEILKPIKATGHIINIIEHYHEHWDGTGYPGELSGALIPKGARILFIVSSFYAMISNRPYRNALPYEKAVEVLKNGGGTVWDARLVDIFISIIKSKRELFSSAINE